MPYSIGYRHLICIGALTPALVIVYPGITAEHCKNNRGALKPQYAIWRLPRIPYAGDMKNSNS